MEDEREEKIKDPKEMKMSGALGRGAPWAAIVW